MTRNHVSVISQQGTCNPIPLIRALHEGLDEFRAKVQHLDTGLILDDPAMRLIVHLLLYLFASASSTARVGWNTNASAKPLACQ
ncbi:hypothetical protein D3C76_1693640 [compost metagenome]